MKTTNNTTSTTSSINSRFRIETPKVQDTSISKQVQELSSQGMSKGDIVKTMTERLGRPIRYQHVFNILKNTSKKEEEVDEQEEN